MAPLARHLFVCGNTRDPVHPRGCCNPAADGALHQAFKKAVAARGLQRTVRANQAGCLDQCEHGPTVVVYPEGVWYGHVTVDDVAEIVDRHVLHGQPVERLRLADGCVNTATCAHKPRRAPGQ
ncbi:MAG: (2Fe-2S) ferredoxin domain-containing protein [Acidobacteriota bacterium]